MSLYHCGCPTHRFNTPSCSSFRALGMGGTRGRLYIKHPHLFKVRCRCRTLPPLGFAQKRFLMGIGSVCFGWLVFFLPHALVCYLRAHTHAVQLAHWNIS